MRQPFQNEKQINEDHFSNPLWYDDKGNNFGSGGHYYFLVEPMPGVNGKLLGVKTLKSENCTELLNYLQYDVEIELYEEIMSDAQSAIFSRNIRRAIFEMAIVCELFTKRKYFSKGGISGLAFDYFEDKGKLKVTVMELISTVAYEVLGESYKDYSPDDYRNVDYLFRCRNKVAHRGEVVFKDDSATLITPDLNLVECWYDSVGNLLNWLDSK